MRSATLLLALVCSAFVLPALVAQERPARHAKILTAYEQALFETRSAQTATQTAFNGIDMVRFDKLFRQFWMSRSQRSRAARSFIKRIP